MKPTPKPTPGTSPGTSPGNTPKTTPPVILVAQDLVSKLMHDGGSWDRFTGLYNDVIAPYNLLAVLAAFDAVDLIAETPLYRHKLKRHLAEAQRIGETYSRRLRLTYGSKHSLFVDYCMRIAASLEKDVHRLRLAVGIRLGRLKVAGMVHEKTLLLTALHLAENAALLHEGYMRICRMNGATREAVDSFAYADMRPLEHHLQEAAQIIIHLTDSQVAEYNADRQIENAIGQLSLRALTKDGEVDFMRLGRITVDALNLDRERWGEEADRAKADLDRIDEERQRTAMAARLRRRFNVKSP